MKHVSFGLLYDMIMNPTMLPVTLSVHSFLSSMNGGVAQAFTNIISPKKKIPRSPRYQTGMNTYDALFIRSQTIDGQEEMVVDVHSDIANLIGNLHGGAAAMAAEIAVRRWNPQFEPTHLDIQYLNPLKGSVKLQRDSLQPHLIRLYSEEGRLGATVSFA